MSQLSRPSRSVTRLPAGDGESFRQILEQMPEGVVTLDAQHRITFANAAALALLGLPEPPIECTLLEALRVPELHALVSGATIDSPISGQFRPNADPDAPWLLGRVSVQRDRGTIVLVVHDVSELHRLETVRQDFVANVSHELRTPVSVILANTETLLNGALDDQQAAEYFLQGLRRNAHRLSDVLSDLLEISRLDAGKYPMAIDDISCAPLVEQVVAAVSGEVGRKRLTVQVDADQAAGARADGKAFRQILANLVDNAVKYTLPEGRIAISVTQQQDRAVIEVSDDGAGIEPQHRERVFERFFRVDAGRSRDMGGTGLGLSIVKNLVESMNGTVEVDESPWGGARFTVRLPARTTPAPKDTEGVQHQVSPSNTLHMRSTKQANQPPVAISWASFDAQPQLRDLRQRLLLMAGRVEQMVTKAVTALCDADSELAREVVRADGAANRDEIEIDRMCLDLLGDPHPTAAHRRLIMLILKVVVDLERIGDLAVNICERAIDLATDHDKFPLSDIRQVADSVHSMIRDALDAFVAQDVHKARAVIARDDAVDQLYTQVFRRVLAAMLQDPLSIRAGIHVQSVAKWLERMADHGTNIAEQVIFMVEGTDIRHVGKLPVAGDPVARR